MAAIVLAGGKSSRMGVNKAFLRMGNGMLIEKVLSNLRKLFREIIIVTATPEEYASAIAPAYGDITFVRDVFPGKGPLGGLYSGLIAAKSEHNLAVACDMPFLDGALIRHMLTVAGGASVVIPRVGGRYETLCAVYARRCIPVMEKQLRRDKLKISDILAHVTKKEVSEDAVRRFDPSLRTFLNINTPADYRRALHAASRAGSAAS